MIDKKMDSRTFRNFYHLKEELIDFCRENNLPLSGNKIELTDRVAHFLDTGELLPVIKKKKQIYTGEITEDTLIEANFVYSEKNRAFFKKHIGKGFSFNVPFQRWLRSNVGKTYSDAIAAYYKVLEEKKTVKSEIDKQFEYNTYIRDFFADNKGKTFKDAIKCWKYKKQLSGLHCYEKEDLSALEDCQ